MLTDERKKRLAQEFTKLVIILCAGFAYYLIVTLTPWKIPCVFNELTGLLCVGCGITRMCISIVRLDFYSAFGYNKAVFVTLPVLAYLLLSYEIRYIKTGQRRMSRFEKWVAVTELVLLLAFGVIRNL